MNIHRAPQNPRFTEALQVASCYQVTNSNLDVIQDTFILPPKNDFTNVLVPKGKKQIPVTIKAILEEYGNTCSKHPFQGGKNDATQK